MKRFALMLALLLSSAVSAQTLQPAASEIVFVSKQMGVPVEGRFKSLQPARFQLRPEEARGRQGGREH